MTENDTKIFTLMVEPHAGCNLRCRHCYSHIQNDSIMTLENFSIAIAKKARDIEKKNYRVLDVIWHGGEPLLAGPDFFRQAVALLNKTISRVRQRHFIQTNGLLLDDEFCRLFRDLNINVGLSLDGPQDLHDELRVDSNGHGTHAAVMRKVRLLETHQVRVGFNAVISRLSIGHEQRVYRFFKEMGYGFRVNPIIPGRNPDISAPYLLQKGEYGRSLCRFFDLWTQTEAELINVSPLDLYLKSLVTGKAEECQNQYSCVRSHIGIKSSGKTVLCSKFQDNIHGNLSDASMDNGSPVQLIKNRANVIADCYSCENRSICYGGCPFNSLAFGKRLMDKDPFCMDYQMIFTHIRKALTDNDYTGFTQETI